MKLQKETKEGWERQREIWTKGRQAFYIGTHRRFGRKAADRAVKSVDNFVKKRFCLYMGDTVNLFLIVNYQCQSVKRRSLISENGLFLGGYLSNGAFSQNG